MVYVLTIISVNVALFAALAGLVIWSMSKHDSEMKSLANRLDGHAMRIDQLYQIIVAMLKDKK